LTVRPLALVICSLSVIRRSGFTAMTWFGAPVTLTRTPPMRRFVMTVPPPYTGAPSTHWALAVVPITSAVMPTPRTEMSASATCAAAFVAWPLPLTDDVTASASRIVVRCASRRLVESDPPVEARSPVSPRRMMATLFKTVVLAAKARPPNVVGTHEEEPAIVLVAVGSAHFIVRELNAGLLDGLVESTS